MKHVIKNLDTRQLFFVLATSSLAMYQSLSQLTTWRHHLLTAKAEQGHNKLLIQLENLLRCVYRSVQMRGLSRFRCLGHSASLAPFCVW